MEGDIMEVKSTIKNVNTYNESSLLIYKTMNRIEIVISSTKTIDMKDEIELNLINRMIDCAITKTGSISQSNDVTFYYNDLEKLMNDYANQRVIEELEKLLENESNEWVDDEDGNEECGVRIVYSIRLRDKIKELKQ